MISNEEILKLLKEKKREYGLQLEKTISIEPDGFGGICRRVKYIEITEQQINRAKESVKE